MGLHPGLSKHCPGSHWVTSTSCPATCYRNLLPGPLPSEISSLPFRHCRYNLDPFGSHTDETLWQALERTCMRDTVGLGACPGRVSGTHAPGTRPRFKFDEHWASIWPRLLVGPPYVRRHKPRLRVMIRSSNQYDLSDLCNDSAKTCTYIRALVLTTALRGWYTYLLL